MQEPTGITLLGKVGWGTAISAIFAACTWIPFATPAAPRFDAGAAHAALLMVGLGISLSVLVIAWSAIGRRTRPDTRALTRAFAGIGLLSAACLLVSTLSVAGLGRAIGDVLESGIDLTIAAGVLAASWLRRGEGSAPLPPSLAPWLPAFCAAGSLLASIGWAVFGASAAVPGLVIACVALLLYLGAGARLLADCRRDTADDLRYLLAAVFAGLLAGLLLWLPGAHAEARMLLGDLYRLVALVAAYGTLFHQVAGGPFIELRDAESTLRAEQQRLSRVRRIAKLGSWEWQIDTDAVWTSEEVRQMFGIPADRAGMTRSEFENLLYRDDVPRLRAAALAAIEGDQPYSVDYRILGADGSPRTMHSEAQLERDEAGRPLRMSGIVQDITERVAVEHALRESDAQIRRMNAELEQRVAERTRQLAAANKELEAFSYSVSHDLQAPLRRIERYADLLASGSGQLLDDSSRDMLKRIKDATTQTKGLITDILKLSQVTRAELRRVAVDLSALARRIVEQFERGAGPARAVEVTVEPDIVVEADAAMLQILLDNLLGNAWKFTSKTAAARIRVGAIATAEGKGFYVSDNGAGFDMRYAHKLFGAFQRLHSQDEFQGTGIGLAIVQRIVNVHGWNIQASGEAGNGATFTIQAQ